MAAFERRLLLSRKGTDGFAYSAGVVIREGWVGGLKIRKEASWIAYPGRSALATGLWARLRQ